MTKQTPLQEAVDILGGQTATSKICGVSPGLVWQWLNGKRPLPEDHCPTIEAATAEAGDRIRCEELRSDVDWQRDPSGQVTGYLVAVAPPEPSRRSQAAEGGDAASPDGTPLHSLKDAA